MITRLTDLCITKLIVSMTTPLHTTFRLPHTSFDANLELDGLAAELRNGTFGAFLCFYTFSQTDVGVALRKAGFLAFLSRYNC
jgi:hypothetical protein